MAELSLGGPRAARLLMNRSFMTAGGTETYLAFQQQFPLREFCAFEIFEDDNALARLENDYLHPIVSAVYENGHGLLLDALLWRAHPDFIAALGYRKSDLARLNRLGVRRTRQAIEDWRSRRHVSEDEFPVLIAADIGPRGDGYKIGEGAPSIATARSYHEAQMEALASEPVDAVCALTMTSANEAIGITKAAERLKLPIIVSPTVETDGRLPDGSELGEFIARVDDATGGSPLFYMVNCAHPSHLVPTLDAARAETAAWLDRFKGFRANSSRKSHEELDNSTELDRGDPDALARAVAEMQRAYALNVVGGCCGTDVEHIRAIAAAAA
jgi:homocysteine S-methyltransferase